MEFTNPIEHIENIRRRFAQANTDEVLAALKYLDCKMSMLRTELGLFHERLDKLEDSHNKAWRGK